MSGSAKDENGTRQATAIGLVAILLWSSLALLTVWAKEIPPFELLALSFGVAFIVGLAVQIARGPAAIAEIRQPLAPWMTAFLGIFLYHAFYFYALSAAPAAQASLIAYLWPLLIVVFSAGVADGEPLRARHVCGALLGLSGTALLLTAGTGSVAGTGSLLAYAAAFGCAVIWAAYSVLNRRFAATPSGMLVGVCGAVAVAGAICHMLVDPATTRPDETQWIAILILGVGPTGLAFFAWDHATKHGRTALLGVLSYLAPVVSTLLLVSAGRAAPTATLLAATALIVGGALLATFGLPS